MKRLIFLTAASVPLPLQAALVECWPFNDVPAGGLAGDGSVQSLGIISGTPAVILGGGAMSTGAGIDLPGGGSGSAAYIDLPNGIVSRLTDATFETWMQIDSLQAWQRIFDFGSTNTGVGPAGGELFGPGGGGEGFEYVILAPNHGTSPALQRLEVRNNQATINTTDSATLLPLGSLHHYTFVWNDIGGGLSNQAWYLDGVLQVQSGDFAFTLPELNDVNNWLGRSNWTGDANMDGTYDQFAIYDNAMDANEVAAAFARGPVPHIPEPTGLVLLAGSLLPFLRRRRA